MQPGMFPETQMPGCIYLKIDNYYFKFIKGLIYSG
ncbi:MAG: hypothetical protein JWQ14_2386 [Adhaeribacter sp.]|nr:hypothetical protein [Adhaeribacter sp.]